jgi:purine-binding chemotaxis protein CheW
MSFYDHFSEAEIAVLQERAERIASTQQSVKEGDAFSALVITVGGESYALPMEALTAVYEGYTIVPLPCVPSFVAGIVNVRGQLVPVMDLAVLLGVPTETPKRSLLIVSNAEFSLGLCADSVGEVMMVLISTLQPVPAALNHVYLKGVLPDGTALLDLDAILNDPTLIVDEVVG